MAVGRTHQLFPLIGLLHPALLSGALAVGLLLWTKGGLRGMRQSLRFRSTKCVLFLLLWVALSVPGALWPGGALVLLLDVFLKLVLLYLLVVGAPRGVRDIERLAFVYFAGAAVYAAVVLLRFRTGGSADRLGVLYYYDANDFATLAVSALPFGIYFALGRQPWWRRLASLGGLGALVVAFVWAGSRGGFIAILIAGVYILFRFTAISAPRRFLGAAALAIVIMGTASDTFWERMRTITSPGKDYNVTGETGRLQIWKRGMGYMLRHPLLGLGANNFGTAEGTLPPLVDEASRGHGAKWGVAHNTIVQIGAELGVPGLIAFVVMIVSAFAGLRHAAPTALAQALTASLVGCLAGAMFLSFGYTEMMYVLVALAVALRRVSPSPTPPPLRA